jgi:hypothetical protein
MRLSRSWEKIEVTMTYKRTLAKITAGLVLAAGATLGAVAPAQAVDTGWNGTKVIKEKPGHIKQQADTGWNGT